MTALKVGLFSGLIVLGVGCASFDRSPPPDSVDGTRAHTIAEPEPVYFPEFGIEDPVVRLTNHGTLVDFRFRVIDPEVALPLLDRDVPIRIVDPATGAKGLVIGSPKIGPLRNTGLPIAGRTYYVLFANPGMVIAPGAKVDIECGGSRLEGLTVEK